MNNETAREMTNHEMIGCTLANVITVFMLLWGTYTRIRLSMEPRGDSKYHLLTFSIGVIIIVFGFIYFIFGLAIMLERRGSSIHKDHNTNVKCLVWLWQLTNKFILHLVLLWCYTWIISLSFKYLLESTTKQSNWSRCTMKIVSIWFCTSQQLWVQAIKQSQTMVSETFFIW